MDKIKWKFALWTVLALKITLFMAVISSYVIFRAMIVLIVFYIIVRDFGKINLLWVLFGLIWGVYPFIKDTIVEEIEKLEKIWEDYQNKVSEN